MLLTKFYTLKPARFWLSQAWMACKGIQFWTFWTCSCGYHSLTKMSRFWSRKRWGHSPQMIGDSHGQRPTDKSLRYKRSFWSPYYWILWNPKYNPRISSMSSDAREGPIFRGLYYGRSILSHHESSVVFTIHTNPKQSKASFFPEENLPSEKTWTWALTQPVRYIVSTRAPLQWRQPSSRIVVIIVELSI